MKLVLALGIMLSLQVVMFLGQTAVYEIAEDNSLGESGEFFDYETSTIKKFDNGNYIVNNVNSANFPDSEAIEGGTSGNIFTDTFSSAKNWVLDKTGIGFLIDIANAPSNQLKNMGMPREVSFALGFMWNAIVILLLVAFILGRTL